MSDKLKQLSSAFSGPRKPLICDRTEAAQKSKILVVTEAAFFAERQADGSLKETTLHNNSFAKKLAASVLEKYHDVVVFYYDEGVRTWIEQGFGEVEEGKNVRFVHIQKDAVADTVQGIVNMFRGTLGLKMYLPRNMRQISWMNVGRFVKDERVVFAQAKNHAELGLEMPKEKTFQDFAAERSRHGWG